MPLHPAFHQITQLHSGDAGLQSQLSIVARGNHAFDPGDIVGTQRGDHALQVAAAAPDMGQRRDAASGCSSGMRGAACFVGCNGNDIGQHSWVTAEELAADIPSLQLTRDSHLLDLGCGYGFLVECARRFGVEAIGLEASEVALAECRRRAMRPAAIMKAIYRATFDRLVAADWRDLAREVRTPTMVKLWLALRHGVF